MSAARMLVVLRKELVDNLRDRRALASALLYPMLGPLILVVMFSFMGRQISEQTEAVLRLPVSGSERAPGLVAWLEQSGVEVLPPPTDPEAAVRSGDLDMALIVAEEFPGQFEAERPAVTRLVVDQSRQSSSVLVSRVRDLLSAYSEQVATERLASRGIDPLAIRPLDVQTTDVSTPQSQAATFIGVLPYFLIFSVFIGGMYLAIDGTAGERERGSLEPLLMNPVRRAELVLGKLAAVMAFTVVSVLETVAAFWLVLEVLPSEQLAGVSVSVSLASMLVVWLLVLPLVPLAAALQIIIASFARSFKEAQNYLGMLPVIPALPGLFLMLTSVRPRLWQMLVPTLSQQLLVNQVIRGEPVQGANVAVATVATLLAAAVLIGVAVRLYQGERVLLGRR